MRIAIIQFPGSNCERETMLAVKRADMTPIEFLWNTPADKLAGFDGFIIVGGFSYEDRSRAGIIAALDPLMQIIKEQNEIGKPILGICNGAQILIESGLVPGIKNYKPCMALTDNKRIQQNKLLGTGYYNAWVHMRLSDGYQQNAFTKYLTPQTILRLPIAHAEGRFVMPAALLKEIKENGLNSFQYCDEEGEISDTFPVNPNGSINNIAAIANKAGNVMAMMPHPERTESCDAIFQSMCAYIKEQKIPKIATLNYLPEPYEIKKYLSSGKECIIRYLITDNQAMSVENALRHRKISVKINSFSHWEILCDSPAILEKIQLCGVLYNDRKEIILKNLPDKGSTFLVRPKEDMQGLEMMQILKNHFGIDGIQSIVRSTLWQVNGDENAVNDVINSTILFNSNSHDCYYY